MQHMQPPMLRETKLKFAPSSPNCQSLRNEILQFETRWITVLLSHRINALFSSFSLSLSGIKELIFENAVAAAATTK